MLDIKTAMTIKEAINKEIGISIAVEDVCRMQPIIATSKTQIPIACYPAITPTILGVVWGTWTILVRIKFSTNSQQFEVCEVSKQEW